jgi:hypothetical protein
MVIFITNFYSNYVNFPKADCGFCGSPSCVSALRKFCLGEMSLEDCIYFKAGLYKEEDFEAAPLVTSIWGKEPGISLVKPCDVDPKRTAMFVYLAYPENQKYGYFDMVTADKIFQFNIPIMGFSPSLGICRIVENDGRTAEGVSNGELLARLALDKEDALWQLSRLTRWLWAAVN